MKLYKFVEFGKIIDIYFFISEKVQVLGRKLPFLFVGCFSRLNWNQLKNLKVKMLFKGFPCRWIQIWGQNYKIQNGGSNMATTLQMRRVVSAPKHEPSPIWNSTNLQSVFQIGKSHFRSFTCQYEVYKANFKFWVFFIILMVFFFVQKEAAENSLFSATSTFTLLRSFALWFTRIHSVRKPAGCWKMYLINRKTPFHRGLVSKWCQCECNAQSISKWLFSFPFCK